MTATAVTHSAVPTPFLVFRASVRAERTKLRSVRSTTWTLLATVGIAVGFGALVGVSQMASWDNLDPVENSLVTDPGYALSFIRSCLEPYGLRDRWCYVDYLGTGYYGHDRGAWRRVCADTDLLLNLSGGCSFWRDEYAAIPHAAAISMKKCSFSTSRGNCSEASFSR